MRSFYCILATLLLFSCISKNQRQIERSDFTFKLPEGSLYMRASKTPGIFRVYFANDSLALDEETDYVELKIRDWFPLIWIDSSDRIYVFIDDSSIKIESKNLTMLPFLSINEARDFMNGHDSVHTRFYIDSKTFTVWMFRGNEGALKKYTIKDGDIWGGWEKETTYVKYKELKQD